MTDITQPTPVPPRLAGRQPALEWAAIALGALTFVWGFLDWFGTGGFGQNGYRLIDGYPPVGFALVAALLAFVNLRPDRTERTAWLAIGMSGLAVLFTIVAMATEPTLLRAAEEAADGAVSLSIQIGLILTLVSTVLQLTCLVAAWLFASGRVTIAGRAAPPVTPGAPEASGTSGAPGIPEAPAPPENPHDNPYAP